MQRGGSSSSPCAKIVGSVENKSTIEVELDWNDIDANPGKRKPIEAFDVAIRDRVRREYLVKGPCQPIGNTYLKKHMVFKKEVFKMFIKFPWLEYSASKYAAFCFWCYLFKQSDKGGRYAEDAFTKTSFNNWKNALEKFNQHVGAANSCHNNARIQFEAFQDQRHSVANVFRSNTRKAKVAYRVRLTASLDVTRFLLKWGLPFRGHDESSSSSNLGNFLELLKWYSQHNDDVSEVLGTNAPTNNQMTSPQIQKELANACASEVTLAIVKDIGDRVFTIVVDETRDVSLKEQMGCFKIRE
ncbi:zinc finger MYM-type protein 1-like [Salvia hispanica]|uniref:zinc finger MYM-type protein 1-like n=1 Tax=Salvia hispanica TaxID=49212 RepID=UPI00200912A4|nr:zinc finger MYM-type protein 1-like [Salvia hispanica]